MEITFEKRINYLKLCAKEALECIKRLPDMLVGSDLEHLIPEEYSCLKISYGVLEYTFNTQVDNLVVGFDTSNLKKEEVSEEEKQFFKEVIERAEKEQLDEKQKVVATQQEPYDKSKERSGFTVVNHMSACRKKKQCCLDENKPSSLQTSLQVAGGIEISKDEFLSVSLGIEINSDDDLSIDIDSKRYLDGLFAVLVSLMLIEKVAFWENEKANPKKDIIELGQDISCFVEELLSKLEEDNNPYLERDIIDYLMCYVMIPK